VGIPDQIGRYTVTRRLGAGGMGEVFLAYSPAGDPVAVKLIRADRLDPQTRARFEREAQVARTVIGTNRVARFLDADPRADRPWLVMEYIPGRTLQEHVEASGPLPGRGLEYQRLALVAITDGIIPRHAVDRLATSDPSRYSRELAKARSLLFVAATRPRDALAISWHGTASRFLGTTDGSA